MVAGVLKPRAARRLTGYASSPPRRMPRLGNVRLSVKLGLSFGVILALTAAIIAVDVHNVQGLESAHNRVTKGVVPRVIAAQRAEAAFADLHFSQTSMVLTGGKTRADEMADLAAAKQAVAALRKTDGDAGSASRVAGVTDADQDVERSSTPSSTPPSSAATPATPSRPWPATRMPRPTT